MDENSPTPAPEPTSAPKPTPEISDSSKADDWFREGSYERALSTYEKLRGHVPEGQRAWLEYRIGLCLEVLGRRCEKPARGYHIFFTSSVKYLGRLLTVDIPEYLVHSVRRGGSISFTCC